MILIAAAAFSIVQDDLDSRIRKVLPSPAEERWLSIPWQPNVMAARAESQWTGKPMLLWVMDGNVLGCT